MLKIQFITTRFEDVPLGMCDTILSVFTVAPFFEGGAWKVASWNYSKIANVNNDNINILPIPYSIQLDWLCNI
jgi:hypothetical protein